MDQWCPDRCPVPVPTVSWWSSHRRPVNPCSRTDRKSMIVCQSRFTPVAVPTVSRWSLDNCPIYPFPYRLSVDDSLTGARFTPVAVPTVSRWLSDRRPIYPCSRTDRQPTICLTCVRFTLFPSADDCLTGVRFTLFPSGDDCLAGDRLTPVPVPTVTRWLSDRCPIYPVPAPTVSRWLCDRCPIYPCSPTDRQPMIVWQVPNLPLFPYRSSVDDCLTAARFTPVPVPTVSRWLSDRCPIYPCSRTDRQPMIVWQVPDLPLFPHRPSADDCLTGARFTPVPLPTVSRWLCDRCQIYPCSRTDRQSMIVWQVPDLPLFPYRPSADDCLTGAWFTPVPVPTVSRWMCDRCPIYPCSHTVSRWLSDRCMIYPCSRTDRQPMVVWQVPDLPLFLYRPSADDCLTGAWFTPVPAPTVSRWLSDRCMIYPCSRTDRQPMIVRQVHDLPLFPYRPSADDCLTGAWFTPVPVPIVSRRFVWQAY